MKFWPGMPCFYVYYINVKNLPAGAAYYNEPRFHGGRVVSTSAGRLGHDEYVNVKPGAGREGEEEGYEAGG